MSSPPSRPPDWRHHAWRWARQAVAAPMTSGAKRASATLLLLAFALFGANLEFTAHEVNAVRAANARSARNAVTITQFCQAVNGINGKEPLLWDHVIAVSGAPPHETQAARRKRLALTRVFITYVDQLFAPIHCQAPLTTRRQP